MNSTRPNHHKQPGEDYFGRLFAQLDQERADAGLELLGWLTADHVNGMPVAREEGIGQFHFADDRRILFLAADVAREVDRDALFSLAKSALEYYGFWDSEQIAGNLGSMKWSQASLDALRDGYFPSPTALRAACRKLWTLDWRWRRAQAGLHDLLATLENREMEPIGFIKRKPLIIKRPLVGRVA